MKKLIPYLICFLGHLNLAAQEEFHVSNYGIKEGLSDRVIWDIQQDSSGFIWLATDNGLDRFDGHEFVNFSDNRILHSEFLTGL